ncbi:MAG TPA: copper uptake system-associated protein [Caulobacterales bacterium]|nr:copper uptake system-associated protein [Caulobacterales bacterium]
MRAVFAFFLFATALCLGACEPASPSADERAIAAVMHGAYDRAGAPLDAGPIAVGGAYAVADWTQGDAGGRALFRKQDGAWRLILCGGDALKTADGLIQAGVDHVQANALARELAQQEASVSPERLHKMSAFAGVMRMDAAPPMATAAHDIELADAWAATTPNGATIGAGYLTIINGSNEADALVGVSSPRAPRVQIHEMTMQGGMMQMRQVARVDLPAGARVVLAPGGYHIMFMDIPRPFIAGQSIPLTLRFDHHRPIEVSLPVRDRGAASSINMSAGHE